MTAQIALHELRVLSRSPFAWLAAALLQLFFRWLFLSAIDNFLELQSSATANTATGLSSFLIVHFLAPISLVFMVATPLLCMHLIAGEKQSNRYNLLLSLPIHTRQLVIGKFLGAFLFQFLMVICSVSLVAVLSRSIQLDLGHLLTASFGLMLYIAVITALTVFYSSLVKKPVLAALASFVTVALLWIAAASSAPDAALHVASPSAHLHKFMQGLIDTREVSYFIAITCILLCLSVWRSDKQRVRGAQR